MPVSTIYTVGHSTHSMDHFVSLLKEHAITCLVDVRSVAASRYNPQYNKESLSLTLKNNGIVYLHFAEEFGARRTDPAERDSDGRVDFEKVRASAVFKKGIERLQHGLHKGYTIVLLCAEAEPMDCHRFSMICPALQENEMEVLHILKDRTLRTNRELEEVLLTRYRKPVAQGDIFGLNEAQKELLHAYKLRNRDIAHVHSKSKDEI